MLTATLRKVGGSVMIAIPPALLDVAEMQVDSEVALTVSDGNIVIRPKKKRRYTLAELLSRCDFTQPEEDRSFLEGPPVGEELL